MASGKHLSISGKDLQRKGYAIEVRIYAEDSKTFFPSPGGIIEFQLPQGKGIHNKCAAEAGSHMTPLYDPMISKLIAWDETRSGARTRMKGTLENYKNEGIKTIFQC